jgi:probable DNA repair protein
MDQSVWTAVDSRATVITATRRLARTFWQEYSVRQQARGLVSWQSPDVLPWGAWLSTLWEEFLYSTPNPPVRLTTWQEYVAWESLVREHPASDELLQVGATAAAAQKAWRLAAEWRLDLSAIESIGNDDARVFAVWAASFRRRCQEHDWVDAARVPDILREHLKRLHLPERILLVGFDEYTPQEREMIAGLRAAGVAVEELRTTMPHEADRKVRIPFPDVRQEIETAARWARWLIETGQPGTIGVVVPDLAARKRQVERIFQSILDPASLLPGHHKAHSLVNLSAGEPLSSYPPIRSALALLALNPQENDWQALSSFVRDRYISGAETERSARGALDVAMRRAGAMRVPMADLHARARGQHSPCPLLGRCLEGLVQTRQAGPSYQTAAQWSRGFSAELTALGWPGERVLDSTEYQAVEAWKDALSDLAGTDFIAGSLDRARALSLLRRIAGETMFQPQGGEAPVQVLGVLEASGLQFDHLWVMGLHDEAWPGPPAPNPFLPIRMQREAGIPRCSPERELAFARLITDRLLASAPDVVISYPIREEDRELAPSPLILRITKGEAADLQLWAGELYAKTIHQSRAVERIVDDQGPPINDEAWQRGGTKVFKYQAACPFRAYAELRLGAEDLKEPTPGLDARQRGNAIHHALEEVWKEIRTFDALCQRTDVAEVILKAAASAIARIEDERGAPLPARFLALEQQRIERVVVEWLELEKTRPPFEVIQPEGECRGELKGVRFKVRIDRIDRLADGREVVIDYKSGSPSVHSWDTERPEEPQLPLYSTMHATPLGGVLFGQVKTGQCRFVGLVDEGVMIPGAEATDLRARIDAWRVVLETLAENFRAGHAETDPMDPDDSCRYCTLAPLCRVAEADS